jgi:hypothetical protein
LPLLVLHKECTSSPLLLSLPTAAAQHHTQGLGSHGINDKALLLFKVSKLLILDQTVSSNRHLCSQQFKSDQAPAGPAVFVACKKRESAFQSS